MIFDLAWHVSIGSPARTETRLLAPDLDILADERLMSNMPADAAGGGALGGAPPAEAEATGPPLTVEVVAS